MPYIAVDVPVELHEILARRAGERGERVEAFALACLTAGLQLPGMQAPDEVRCSFCGRGRDEARHMVHAQNARICAECVAECRRLIESGEGETQAEQGGHP